MIVYALRHKATGETMPARMFRHSARGWSHWTPGNASVFGPLPRLFPTRKGADNARVKWAMGVWERQRTAGSYFEPPEEDAPAPMSPPTPRHKDDLEIVPYLLEEKPTV